MEYVLDIWEIVSATMVVLAIVLVALTNGKVSGQGPNLATKCATLSGTRALGQTEGYGATTGVPYVEPGPRDGRPPRCDLLRIEPSARRIVARV